MLSFLNLEVGLKLYSSSYAGKEAEKNAVHKPTDSNCIRKTNNKMQYGKTLKQFLNSALQINIMLIYRDNKTQKTDGRQLMPSRR